MAGFKVKLTKLGKEESIGTVSKNRRKINVKNSCSKENNKIKVTIELEVDINDEAEDDENTVVSAVVLR